LEYPKNEAIEKENFNHNNAYHLVVVEDKNHKKDEESKMDNNLFEEKTIKTDIINENENDLSDEQEDKEIV